MYYSHKNKGNGKKLLIVGQILCENMHTDVGM